MTDPTTACDWMFALTHPVHGPAICEAAGCRVLTDSHGTKVTHLRFPRFGGIGPTSVMPQWQTAAICFGVQVAIAKHTGDAAIEHSADVGWFVTHGSVPMSDAWPTPEAAWLAAAREWLEVSP